jgi:hypothetical protein
VRQQLAIAGESGRSSSAVGWVFCFNNADTPAWTEELETDPAEGKLNNDRRPEPVGSRP